MNRIHIIKLNRLKIFVTLFICIGIISCAVIYYRQTTISCSTAPANASYVVFAMNDLGMHCIQNDYSDFMILPPANTLMVQVFKKGYTSAELITSGIEVKYELIDNTSSADKINFWDFASYYGFDLQPNEGITGNWLSGSMTLSADKKYFEATAIPVVPYNDNSSEMQAYQTARITVYDQSTKKLIATCESVVVPVSDELHCDECHGQINTGLSILSSHDKLSGTQFVDDLKNNIRHKCSECHADNILGAPGVEGVKSLSQAMHGFHADKMELSEITPPCGNCHPGPVTKCYRGVMYANGVSCDDSHCHGDMATIAKSIQNGREPWLQEPNCSNCHTEEYSANPSTLYRNSYLLNGPTSGMNDIILCLSCHNSPHSEWPSTLPLDNKIPLSLQGSDRFIYKCTVCHQASGTIHKKQKTK